MDDEWPGLPDRDGLFAENVKAERERHGWSQGELARRVVAEGVEGFHQTTISRIEKGDRPVKIGEAYAIAAALGTTVGRLVLPLGTTRLARNAQNAARDASDSARDLVGAIRRFEFDKLVLRESLRKLEADSVAQSLSWYEQFVKHAKLLLENTVGKAEDMANRDELDDPQ